MKLNKKVVVLTGGIASGKSTVGNILKEKGYEVVESDKIVHQLYNKNTEVYKKLTEEFGEKIAGEESINRKKLAGIVYGDKSKLKKLNKIVHEHVIIELLKRVKSSKKDIIFLDIPLMIEEKEKLEKYGLVYDEIWLVKSKEEIRIKRIKNRDNISFEESRKIINNQMKDEEKEKHVHQVIENNDTIQELKNKIDRILTNLKIEKDKE